MKAITTFILTLVLTTCVAQHDTTRVDYIKILQIDTTQNRNEERFFSKLKAHYESLGEMAEISCVFGESYFDIKRICIRFEVCPMRWFCYTPAEAENELYKILNK